MTYEDFKEILMAFLNKNAPVKQKVIRENNAPFLGKRLKRSCIC